MKKGWVTEQKTANVLMSRPVEVMYATQPHFTQYYCPPWQARNLIEAETAEICQSQSVERQQYLWLSVDIQNISLEVTLNKTAESYND